MSFFINYLFFSDLQVIACAQQGFLSYGVELNPWFVIIGIVFV